MRKLYEKVWIRLLVIILFASMPIFTGNAQVAVQNDSHAEYITVKEELAKVVSQRIKELNAMASESPHLVDSLRPLMKQVFVDLAAAQFECLKRYAEQDWCTEEFCRAMTDLPKEKVVEFYSLLPAHVADNDYGRDIKRFIEMEQVVKGGRYFDFTAETITKEFFRFSDLVREKDVLLIIDGLGCMGKEMLEYIKNIYGGLDHNGVEFVSFSLNCDRTAWEKENEYFNLPWPFVSDLKGVHSEVVSAYAVSATPTCFYVKEGGQVEIISLGFGQKLQEKIWSVSGKRQ